MRDISFGQLFADAGALWRAERDLLLPIAGVFFFVPLLGVVTLLPAAALPDPALNPEAFQKAVLAYYVANSIPLLCAFAVTVFGTFATLNVFLQGGGRTLGEVLMSTLRHFLPFLGMYFVLSIAFTLGLLLFLAPGVLVFCRSWLAAPAFAAAPERGVLAALGQGWSLSGRWNWLVLLLATGAVTIAMVGAFVLVSAVLGTIARGLGGAEVVGFAAGIVVALLQSAGWIALAVLRVAIYRASVPRQGI